MRLPRGSGPVVAVPSISPAVSSSSRPASPVRWAKSRSSASRSGTRCTGVPVITSSPNPLTRASSGAAIHGVSAATSGAETKKPISPAPDRMAASPAAGCGVPAAMCTRPSPPRSRQLQPITIRPVCALRSGWRRNRQASRPSRRGTVQAAEPNAPRNRSDSIRPAKLCRWNQVVAATTRAAARKARPTPSRWCAGSRSRAFFPNRRAPKPTACAATIHRPATSRASQPARIRIGSAVRCRDRAAVPRGRPLLAGRFLPWPDRFWPERFRAERFWAGRFRPERDGPPRLWPWRVGAGIAFLLVEARPLAARPLAARPELPAVRGCPP